jgi:Mg-chelatase subunit ChlD
VFVQAADAARQSTIEFLQSIRRAVVKKEYDVIPDEAFAEFLGIPVGTGKTLCFVIDTTGSMSEEIAAVKQYTIRITQQASQASESRKPSDYVLSPFNDPG